MRLFFRQHFAEPITWANHVRLRIRERGFLWGI